MTDSPTRDGNSQQGTPSGDPAVISFDGVCALCNGLIDFLIRIDHRRRLRFRALPDGEALESIIVIYQGTRFEKSDAVLAIARILGFPWSLLLVFKILPRFIRDALYSVIARYRYATFGKHAQCRIPVAEERDRFIS